jgi:hypothetical protein
LTLIAATGIVDGPDLFVFVGFSNPEDPPTRTRNAAAAAAEWVAK